MFSCEKRTVRLRLNLFDLGDDIDATLSDFSLGMFQSIAKKTHVLP